MAPEMIMDHQHVTEKADVWSLGVVFWEMLTLEVPFQDMPPAQLIGGEARGSGEGAPAFLLGPPWLSQLRAGCGRLLGGVRGRARQGEVDAGCAALVVSGACVARAVPALLRSWGAQCSAGALWGLAADCQPPGVRA
jgi:hypothetical protein